MVKKSETVTLKVATYFAGTSPIYTAVTEPWMKRVTELTDGNVQFDYYPGEQLGKAADLLNLTRDRVTDISVFPCQLCSRYNALNEHASRIAKSK